MQASSSSPVSGPLAALPAQARPRRRALAPLEPVSARAKWLLGVGFFVLFVAVWAAFTLGGFVPPTFLASPVTMLHEGVRLFVEYDFLHDIVMTVWRVFGGFALAVVIAVPLGIAMGAHKGVEAFVEPFVSFCRYLPASAFIPLLILWAGIGETQKILVIFIGAVFQITLMVAVTVGSARRDLVEAAYTLGASPRGIVRRVLIPGAAPDIAEILRLVLGWAWTYVIVAELIGSSSGIGHMIIDSQALLNTGQIIFGIIVIGVIGLVSDLAFKLLNRRLFAVEFTAMSHLSIEGVSRIFANPKGQPTQALLPVDFEVRDNDFVTILGPSGCGKSTLLRIVAGLDRPTSGRVLLDGQPVEGPGADRGMVFQSYTLFPWLTVEQNIRFGLRERGLGLAEQRERSDYFIDRVGLRGFEQHFPKQLSGGMQQRTAIARALANDPKILLLDEPFGALDNQTRVLMQELLLGIWESARKTVLFVTHDIDEAIFMASRVAVFSARPGRIKTEIAVAFPHPRHYTIKTSPEFMTLKARLTEEIRAEAMAATH